MMFRVEVAGKHNWIGILDDSCQEQTAAPAGTWYQQAFYAATSAVIGHC